MFYGGVAHSLSPVLWLFYHQDLPGVQLRSGIDAINPVAVTYGLITVVVTIPMGILATVLWGFVPIPRTT